MLFVDCDFIHRDKVKKLVFNMFTDPIVKEQGRMATSNSPTPNALQGPVNSAE